MRQYAELVSGHGERRRGHCRRDRTGHHTEERVRCAQREREDHPVERAEAAPGDAADAPVQRDGRQQIAIETLGDVRIRDAEVRGQLLTRENVGATLEEIGQRGRRRGHVHESTSAGRRYRRGELGLVELAASAPPVKRGKICRPDAETGAEQEPDGHRVGESCPHRRHAGNRRLLLISNTRRRIDRPDRLLRTDDVHAPGHMGDGRDGRHDVLQAERLGRASSPWLRLEANLDI